MAKIGIIFGIALCGLTVFGLVVSPLKSPYQFIPMILGIPTLFLGVVALNPHRRRQSMQVSASLATMGLVVGIARSAYMIARWGDGATINGFALRMVLLMTSLCLAFIVAWAVGGWRARRRDNLGPTTSGNPQVTLPRSHGHAGELAAPILGQDSEPQHDFANRD